MVPGKKFFLGIETGRYQQNSGIENGRYQHILVSKQVSVSADTNVQSIGIGIELKILVSPNTREKPAASPMSGSPTFDTGKYITETGRI